MALADELLAAPMGDLHAMILAGSPLAYWRLDDASGTPQDSSGNGKHMATTTGTPDYQYAAGPRVQKVMHYLASEGHEISGPVSTATNNLTMEFWILPEAVSANNTIICYNGNNAGNGWGVVINTNLTIGYLAGGIAFGTPSTNRLAALCWNHVVVLRDSGTWKYYINGALDPGTAGSTAPGTPSGGSTGPRADSGRAVQQAYMAIYNSVLSLATIQSHYRAARHNPYGVHIA